MTPTQRTLAACRELVRECAVVEKFNRFAGPHGIRQDAFGFIDILCIDPVKGVVAVQSCGQSFSEHIHKMAEERKEIVAKWLKWAPLELWGWRKLKEGNRLRWRPRIADAQVVDGVVVFVERKPTGEVEPKIDANA